LTRKEAPLRLASGPRGAYTNAVQSPLAAALVALLAAAALWTAYALSEARTQRRFEALEQAWRAYAAGHGLLLVPFAELSGVASDVGPPLVRGEVQGVALELSVHSSTRPRTCVEATLPGVATDFVLVIRPRAHLPLAFVRPSLQHARTGNKVFDATFALLSNQPDLARSLLDRRLAQVVLGFPRAFVDLCASENRLLLSWKGMETDPMVLDAAVEVVFTACRRRA
jgi:hypothetical protein